MKTSWTMPIKLRFLYDTAGLSQLLRRL